MVPESASTAETSADSDVQGFESAADHVSEARRRAREVLSCESHLGEVDDWRQAAVTARDAVVAIWLVWIAMRGIGTAPNVGPILASAAVGIALYLGIAAAIATRVRLRYFETELDRERQEIRDEPEHERQEVQALYAAKGFREPLLTQITDILCADDDRLLKVMMEEELGLFIHHLNHPLLVGLWNTAAAAAGGLLLALPVCFQHPDTTIIWMPAGTAAILLGIAVTSAWLTRRSAVPMVALWLATAGFAGGVTFLIAELLAGQTG